MSSHAEIGTGTSEEVLQYYSRNWDKIANCYDLDGDGFPIDPAWYRRRLYKDFLLHNKPESVLDVGCGGGWTVLDALEMGINAKGIEPVAELKNHGCNLLQENGHDPGRITQDDLAILAKLPSNSLDCIALLSVLPHVPKGRWDEVHRNIARVLRPGGRLVAAYRNELFDLYTFNSFTLEFYDKALWGCQPCSTLANGHLGKLKSLITNPDMPGPYFTAAKDKSFGNIERVKSNPLTMPSFFHQYGLRLEKTRYYHFHCVPPLLQNDVENYRDINHQLELTMSDDWRGNLMAAIFMIEAIKM